MLLLLLLLLLLELKVQGHVNDIILYKVNFKKNIRFFLLPVAVAAAVVGSG